MREIPIIPHAKAYPRGKRVRHAMWWLRKMADLGPATFEATKSNSHPFGLEPELIRRMKARLRNELSFSGEGK